MDKLKKALQPDQLNKLMENREDTTTRNIIIEHNLRLIQWVINRYFKGYAGVEFEDLFQIGVLGLMDSIDRYDSSKGAFSSYAVWYIRRFIQREMFSFSTDVSLEATIPGTEDITYKDSIPNGERPFEEVIEDSVLAKEIRERLKRELTDIEYSILDLNYGFEGKKPKSLDQISEKLSRDKNTIKNIKVKSFSKLRTGYTMRLIKRDLDLQTSYYSSSVLSHTKSSNSYRHTSSVERLVLHREDLRQKLEKQYNIK